jgi:hypothetical protein
MPVHIVMEQAHGRRFVRLRHGIAALLGFLLILVGWATLPALGYLLYVSRPERGQHHQASTVGNGTVVAFLALVAVLLVGAPLLGFRLVRGSRRLVLFLRRFGYTDATHALTFCVLTTIGASWRLVTLDDAAVAPVGVSHGLEKVLAAGDLGSRFVRRMQKAIGFIAMQAARIGLLGMGAVVGYTYLHHRSQLAMLDNALGHHHHARNAAAAGTFRDFFIVTLAGMFALLALGLLGVVALPLLQPWLFFSRSLRRAEQAKVTQVVTMDAGESAARDVRKQARNVFSPRLMVLHVDTDVWRHAVKCVADVASVVLIDVSVPTENLLWEISEVVHDPATACVLVGQADRLRSFGARDEPLRRRLGELLDGRTILAYETTEQGMKRFARALRATLEVAE